LNYSSCALTYFSADPSYPSESRNMEVTLFLYFLFLICSNATSVPFDIISPPEAFIESIASSNFALFRGITFNNGVNLLPSVSNYTIHKRSFSFKISRSNFKVWCTISILSPAMLPLLSITQIKSTPLRIIYRPSLSFRDIVPAIDWVSVFFNYISWYWRSMLNSRFFMRSYMLSWLEFCIGWISSSSS